MLTALDRLQGTGPPPRTRWSLHGHTSLHIQADDPANLDFIFDRTSIKIENYYCEQPLRQGTFIV